jgi:uncharacterized protein (DUF4415 family)
MRFEWDETKNQRNLVKHRVSFETAALAFDDPYALTQRDELSDEEERWITLGSASPATRSFELFRLVPQRRVRGKGMRKLTKEQKRDIAAIAAMKDEDIDLSDIPEVLDWSKAEIGKFYRPPKRSVTMRLDGDVIDWLKGYGKGYQTRVNLLLRHAMASATTRTTQLRQARSRRSRA